MERETSLPVDTALASALDIEDALIVDRSLLRAAYLAVDGLRDKVTDEDHAAAITNLIGLLDQRLTERTDQVRLLKTATGRA